MSADLASYQATCPEDPNIDTVLWITDERGGTVVFECEHEQGGQHQVDMPATDFRDWLGDA